MAVTTGSRTLDEMLNGGYPEGRAVLATGTPGTGKSTLAMQFLQAGLDRGDDCLFISTEQTIEELRDGFGSFAFDLDHENLTITSLHARSGRTLESDDELVIERFDEGDVVGEGFSASFTSDRIRQVLDGYKPADRIVLDSVTGLEPMADSREEFRRGVLDLIQQFTTGFDATTLFTAEYVGTSPRAADIETISTENTIQYNVYGVLRLWREEKKGRLRRFIDIMKMRGVDHDSRQHEIMFSEEGIDIAPRRRALPSDQIGTEHLSTGLEGLDGLLAGGLPKGSTTLFEHDGRANVGDLLFTAASNALREGMSLVMIPRVSTSPARIDELVQRSELGFDDTTELLDANRFFVIDALGAWQSHENVFNPRLEDAGLQYLMREIRNRTDGDGLFLLLNTEAKVHTYGAEETRRFRYWLPSQFLTDRDVMLDVHNPKVMDEEMAAFYTDAATMGIETWLDETGLQYLRLQKGQVGELGEVVLIEYLDESPYVEIRY